MPKAGDDVVICVGRESIEALATGEPVKVGDGEYLLMADSYDHPYRRITELEEALRAVVRDVNDYEETNKLSPNPGRSECWDSVARAKAVLQKSPNT